MASLLPSHELNLVVSAKTSSSRTQTKFTSETGREAGVKSVISRQPETETETKEANERLVSPEASRSLGESEVTTDPNEHPSTGQPQSSYELGWGFGISGSTSSSVRFIMGYRTPDQIQNHETRAHLVKRDVRTMVQSERLKKELAALAAVQQRPSLTKKTSKQRLSHSHQRRDAKRFVVRVMLLVSQVALYQP